MKTQVKINKSKKENNMLLAEAILETEEPNNILALSDKLKKQLAKILNNKKTYIGGIALISASFVANILNYVFNTYLGRVLSFEDFALIGLIGGFYSLASIFFGAYLTTVNYRSGFLIGKYGDAAGYTFWEHIRKQMRYPSLIIAVIWLLATPLLMNFFHTDNVYLFFFFSIVLLVGFFNNINQGFLSAKMMFGSLAVISIVEPLTKLIATFLLVSLGLKIWTFSAIPVGAFFIFITAWLLITKQVRKEKIQSPQKEILSYSKKFFYVSMLTGFSSIAFFTFDIFLAKHFLTPTQAGQYALVSLVGKMIFFLGNLTAPFVIPLISRYEGAQKKSLHALYLLLGCTSLFTLVGFILLGIFGSFTVPLLYGSKAHAIVPYLLFFTFGMTCYTISNVLVNYYLVRRIYTFTFATSFLILLQIGLIVLFHDNVKAIVMVMTGIFTTHLVLTTMLHICIKQVKIFEKYMTETLQLSLIKYPILSFNKSKK